LQPYGIVPFTASEFLDVFAAYNQALWPFVAMLWVLTALVMVAALARASAPPMLPRLLLAGHWLWAGLVYHALFFTAINPAAWLFAAMFVTQGVMLVTFPSGQRAGNIRPGSVRRVASSVFVLYGLLYPAIAWADGFDYPRMPTFGVPCPTVVLTIGFLVSTSTHSIRLCAIPIAWSFIGGTAAWLFGMHADLALPAAGLMLTGDLMFRRSHVMKKLSLAGASTILVAMLVTMPASSVFAQAAQHDHAQQAQPQKEGMKMGEMKMGEMKMDAAMMAEMAAKKKANTDRITSLMAQVKSASGDAKVAALADVVAVLLEERTAMSEHCASMMSTMKK